MTAASTPIARTRFRTLGTTAEFAVTDPERLAVAEHVLRAERGVDLGATAQALAADRAATRVAHAAGRGVLIGLGGDLAGQRVHRIVDPRTGTVPDPVWRTVSVAESSFVDSKTTSSAAVVHGANVPECLAKQQFTARIAMDGLIRTVADWPEDLRADATGTTS